MCSRSPYVMNKFLNIFAAIISSIFLCTLSSSVGHFIILLVYYFRSTFLFLLILSNIFIFLSFKFLMQPVPGQHSIWKDVWIMMDILLPSLQLMQLQRVEFLLGIGGRPQGMVKPFKLIFLTYFHSRCKVFLTTWLDEFVQAL